MGKARHEDSARKREIGGATTGAVVAYVRRVCGDDGLGRVLVHAGERRGADELADTTTWSSYAEAVALFEAAVHVVGRDDVARSIGEELLLQYADTEVAALLRSLGSPAEVLRNVAATAAKYSSVTRMEALETSDGRVLISARTGAGATRDRHFCLFTEGLLSQATPLFGLPKASVVELDCQTRGDARCLYRVSWDPETTADDDLERKCAHLESELKAITARFESLQATAAELVTARTVDEVLQTVTRRVGLAVRAPRHLLAVRVTGNEPLRVHHNGFASDAAAREAAEQLLDPDAGEPDESCLVVDIATVRMHFGKIAALYPAGSRFFAEERRLLQAYAGHIAAALESAAALEHARKQNATARALLELGRALAGLGTPEDVASRLALAMSSVVECQQSGVFLWSPDKGSMELAASVGLTEDGKQFFEHVAISAADTPVLARMLHDPAPVFLTRDTTDDFLAHLLDRAGVGSVAVAPIVSGSTFFGVVTAAFESAQRLVNGDDDLVERLTGMADHAATALQNGELLDRIQQQALRDPLTGLPNARLLQDRVELAIAHAKRNATQLAVMFVDFDYFKPVNDTFGHSAGDAVLVEASKRMRAALRAGDTVARLAGDEFVILLPGLTAGAGVDAVAEKISLALQQPFCVAGERIHISGSIGIALFPDAGDEYGVLVRAADAAMYAAKKTRRASYAHAPGREPLGDRRPQLASHDQTGRHQDRGRQRVVTDTSGRS